MHGAIPWFRFLARPPVQRQRLVFLEARQPVHEIDEAFIWLERAYQAREAILFSLLASPQADPLRSDPRFQDLLRRIGFPES